MPAHAAARGVVHELRHDALLEDDQSALAAVTAAAHKLETTMRGPIGDVGLLLAVLVLGLRGRIPVVVSALQQLRT
jgi:hypothetical protein